MAAKEGGVQHRFYATQAEEYVFNKRITIVFPDVSPAEATQLLRKTIAGTHRYNVQDNRCIPQEDSLTIQITITETDQQRNFYH